MSEISLFYGEVKVGPLCICAVTVNHGILLIGDYSPALNKKGYTGFALSVILSVIPA